MSGEGNDVCVDFFLASAGVLAIGVAVCSHFGSEVSSTLLEKVSAIRCKDMGDIKRKRLGRHARSCLASAKWRNDVRDGGTLVREVVARAMHKQHFQ
jgi:hypothetical protein